VTRITYPRKTSMGFGPALRWASRLAGTALLASAALKSRQYASAPATPRGLWSIRSLEPGLIAFEIFSGLWLFTGAFPMVARRVSIGCFSVFACYTLYEALAGKADCGCFGQVKVNPWFTFILDVAIVLSLTFFGGPAATGKGRSQWSQGRWPVAAAAGIGLAVGLTAAMLHPKVVPAANGLAAADNGAVIILEPHKWIGNRLPVLAHIVSQRGNLPLGHQLATGNWTVMFYHASCDECRATIPVYEQLAQREILAGKIPHVAFVHVPSGSEVSTRGLFHSSEPLHGTLDATHNWFAQTPIVIQLHNGTVIAVETGQSAMGLSWLIPYARKHPPSP
jgi:hypothetical protein